MATRLEGMLEPRGDGRGKRYDWSSWLDGGQWKLVKSVDFVVGLYSFRTQAKNAARKRGCELVIQLTQDDEGRSVVLMQAKPKVDWPKPGEPALQLDPPQHATAGDAIDQNSSAEVARGDPGGDIAIAGAPATSSPSSENIARN